MIWNSKENPSGLSVKIYLSISGFVNIPSEVIDRLQLEKDN
jgi:hypothetical protein